MKKQHSDPVALAKKIAYSAPAFALAVVGIPVYVYIPKFYTDVVGINTGSFIGVFFLGPGDAHIYGILVFLSGIGFGATLALPSTIQADVIDYDELLTGQRREEQYIGLWSIVKKFAAAIGVGAGLSILVYAGYEPNVAHTEQVQLTLRTLYALMPSACNMIAFLIVLAYPISSRVHKQNSQRDY